jgi:hypothetical protein
MNSVPPFSLSTFLGQRNILCLDSSSATGFIEKSTGIQIDDERFVTYSGSESITLDSLRKELKKAAFVVDSNPFRLAKLTQINPSIIRIFFDRHHRSFECSAPERSPLTLACLANAHGVMFQHNHVAEEGKIDNIFGEAFRRHERGVGLEDLLVSNGGGGIAALARLYGFLANQYVESATEFPPYAWKCKPDWLKLAEIQKHGLRRNEKNEI